MDSGKNYEQLTKANEMSHAVNAQVGFGTEPQHQEQRTFVRQFTGEGHE